MAALGAPVILLAATFALAAAPPPVVNGEITKDYPEVVFLYLEDASGRYGAGCTGELIAPRWVLTAAHCVSDTSDFTVGDVYVGWVNNSSEMDQSNTEIARAWYPNSLYSSSGQYNDIALVELRTDHDGPYLPLTDRALTKEDKGTVFRLVGFGITSDDDTAQNSKKRTAEIPLDSYDSRLLYTLDTETDKNACHGDSGGPFLREYEDGTYAVAGIVDFSGDSRTGSCMKDGTYSARVDAYMDFIDGYTTDYTLHEDAVVEDTGTTDDTGGSGDSDSGGSENGNGDGDDTTDISQTPGFCAVASPELASVGLVLAGLAAASRRRR